jgi:hypothetical protein
MLDFVRDRRGHSTLEAVLGTLSAVAVLMVLNVIYGEDWSLTARLPAFGLLLPGWVLGLGLIAVCGSLLYLIGRVLDRALIRFDRAREQRRVDQAAENH